jgi:hypothetical protein
MQGKAYGLLTLVYESMAREPDLIFILKNIGTRA